MSIIDNRVPDWYYQPRIITTDNTAGDLPITDFNKIVKKEMKRLKRENPEVHKAIKMARKQAKMLRKAGICPNCGRCPVCEPAQDPYKIT